MSKQPELPPDEAERVRMRLRELHQTRFGGSRNDLARALDRTGPGIGNLLKGKGAPSLDTAVRVAKLLNLTEHEVRTGRRPALAPVLNPLDVCLAYWEGRWTQDVIDAARRRFSKGTSLSPPALTAMLDEMQAKSDK
jgi:DNA-binding XRE family transcriptional regulator